MFSFKQNLITITIIVFSICDSSYAPLVKIETNKNRIHSMIQFFFITLLYFLVSCVCKIFIEAILKTKTNYKMYCYVFITIDKHKI